jgi:hypothetical protein
MFHFKAIAFAGVVYVGTSTRADYAPKHKDGYGHDYGHQPSYKEPSYHDNYGHQPSYDRYDDAAQYGYDHGHYNEYSPKKYTDFKKSYTLFDEKEWWKLYSSYDQCKSHKCKQYGYESYEYSDDYKQMMSAVGNYVTCNVACAAATFVKATCKQSEYYNKLYWMADAQLQSLDGKDAAAIRDMHLKRGEACILQDDEFVNYEDIAIQINDIHEKEGAGYVSADTLLKHCQRKDLYATASASGLLPPYDTKQTKYSCSKDLTRYLDALKSGAGSDILSHDCTLREGACTHVLQANPRAAPIEESQLCELQGYKFVVMDKHDDIEEVMFIENLYKYGFVGQCEAEEPVTLQDEIRKAAIDAILKDSEGCEQEAEIKSFISRNFKLITTDEKNPFYKIKGGRTIKRYAVNKLRGTHGRYVTVNGNLPSKKREESARDAKLAEITTMIMEKKSEDDDNDINLSVKCKYEAALLNIKKEGELYALQDEAEMKVDNVIEATGTADCVAGEVGYEFQNVKQFSTYLYEMLTSEKGCSQSDLVSATSVNPAMVYTYKCAQKVYDMQCQCMNVVLNCFQEQGYYEGNAATKTIGKVFGLLCALLWCKVPKNFAFMNGVQAFRSAQMIKVVLAQANLLDAPTMSSLSPASFAFIAFGMGMVAFVVTQAVLKTRRGNLSTGSSASKSLLAAQSTL